MFIDKFNFSHRQFAVKTSTQGRHKKKKIDQSSDSLTPSASRPDIGMQQTKFPSIV